MVLPLAGSEGVPSLGCDPQVDFAGPVDAVSSKDLSDDVAAVGASRSPMLPSTQKRVVSGWQ